MQMELSTPDYAYCKCSLLVLYQVYKNEMLAHGVCNDSSYILYVLGVAGISVYVKHSAMFE